MGTILSAIIPVFIVAGAGFGLRRFRVLDAGTLSTLNIYIFIPSLVFATLSRNSIDWTVFGRFALGCVCMVVVMRVLLGIVARYRGIQGDLRNAFFMTMFMNLGNFGLPVSKFAFGDEGLALAIVVMVCGSFLQNSVGLYFAQRAKHGVRKASLRVFYFPMIYAFILALLCERTGWQPPDAVFRAISITADAAIAVQLMVLGVKLAETRLDTSANVFIAGAMRLCAGPLVALGIVALTGMTGLPGKVFILQMSGPVAVGMAVFGVQFNVEPRFLSSAVSWTFLLSVFSVSAVLYFLA